MSSDNYWARRLRTGRLSRRRFVAGSATAGIGAASFGLVGCGDDDDDDDASPTSVPSGNTTTSGSPTTTSASPSAAAQDAKQKGGIARFSSANNTYDTFDADRTRFGPMGTVLGLANQSVVGWESFTESKLGGYFAESWEQPDDTTFTFKVREGLFWHDKAPVNGREANANDIVHHIERNKAGKLKDGTEDPNFYRKPLFEVVDTVEEVDERTVRVTMSKPWPFFLNTLAGTWTKVQAPEAVEQFEADYAKFNADLIIGTGDFMLTQFNSEGSLSFRRHPKAWREPWWEGIDYVPLFTDAAALQAAFEQRQIDSYAPTQQAIIDDLKNRLGDDIYEKAVFTPNPVTGTYYGGAAPWSDARLIGAIYQTMDRRGLIQQLVQGRGALCAFVPPAWAPFSIAESELIKNPGYLEDREADYKDARAKWDAGGGAALGTVIIDIPDIYEGAYSGVAALITNHLSTVLGNTFEAKIEPYSTITSKLVAQKYGNGTPNTWFGWGNPPADPDPSVDFINAFKSTSSQFPQWEVQMQGMDALLEKLATEFDVDERVKLVQDASKILLSHNGGGITPLYEGISNILYWNYFHIGEVTHQVTTHNVARDLWFDQKDPSYAGRPT